MTSLFIPRRASIADGHLHFLCDGGFLAALRDGCFALRIPEEFNLGPAVKLAREFYLELGPKKPSLDVSYRGFRQKADIYFDRDHFQTEHILIDTPRRKVEFPPAVNVVCEQMYELARIVLREILSSIGVARPLWNRVTDRCVERGGVQWFAVNHYRPERAQVGAPAHKDTGFVTILYCEQPGLEASLDGEWRGIEPVEGHFLVNFGGALEVLTKHLPIKVDAVLHRVMQCAVNPHREDRFSFAAFLNPSADGDLYQVSADGATASNAGSVEAFLREFNKETWRDDYAGFGITKSSVDFSNEKNSTRMNYELSAEADKAHVIKLFDAT